MYIVGVFSHGDIIKGFPESLLGVLVSGHIKGGQIGFSVLFRYDIVQKFEGSTGNMIAYKQSVPVRAVVVYIKFLRQNGFRVYDLDRGEVKLTGEGGDVGGPNVTKGGGGAEKCGRGAKVNELMGGPVEADYFPAHNISDLVTELVVGEDIETGDIGKER